VAGLAAQPVLAHASDLQPQVIAFRDARGPLGCRGIVLKSGVELARALAKVGAHGGQAVVVFDPRVAIEWLEQREPSSWPVCHGHGHGVVQGDHRVVRQAQQHAVKRDYLRPIRVLGASRFVV